MARLVVGCMTGTSIDGLDAALVEIEGTGLAMRAKVAGTLSRPLGEIGQGLRALAEQAPTTAGEIAGLNHRFSKLHAGAVSDLLDGRRADLIAVHGQTVFHQPPVSWQLINPAVIAQATGSPVVCDLRAADLAAGGQGAPITPLADWVLFRHAEESRAIVNLGGFCNVTLVEAGGSASTPGVRGFDVCACNHLLDTVARRALGRRMDEGGGAALTGHVHDDALDDLRAILLVQASGKRSLGTGDEAVAWVGRHWAGGGGVSGQDLAATACEALGERIAAAVQGAGRVLTAGGGVKNAAVVKALNSCCSTFVEPTDHHGVPAAYREAVCMAVLGALCQDGEPITLGHVTGVTKPPLSGVWAGRRC